MRGLECGMIETTYQSNFMISWVFGSMVQIFREGVLHVLSRCADRGSIGEGIEGDGGEGIP